MFPFCFPLCVNRLNKLLHSGGTITLHFLSYMTVNIQGECGSGMAQIFLHCFYIVTGLYCSNSIGVPQIMEACFGTADLLHNLFEGFIHGGGGEVTAKLIAEDKTIIFPDGAVS